MGRWRAILGGLNRPDALDWLGPTRRQLLHSAVTAVLSFLFLWLQEDAGLGVVHYRSDWVIVVGVVLFAGPVAALMLQLRKSSSLVLLLLIALPPALFDFWLEAHVRALGREAFWSYHAERFPGLLPVPFRFFVAWLFDGAIVGPLSLWVSRRIAQRYFRDRHLAELSSQRARRRLFDAPWTEDPCPKPERGWAFWALRLFGLGFLAYLGFLAFAVLGPEQFAHFPGPVARLPVMTYENPALAINTYSKILMLAGLAFVGAYNRGARFWASLALTCGFIASTVYCAALYWLGTGTDAELLKTSAYVDAATAALGACVTAVSYRDRDPTLRRVPEFPDLFSVPARVTRWAHYAVSVLAAAMVAIAIVCRFTLNGERGLGAVFGNPDPTLSNTLTQYTTASVLALLLARREKLRHQLGSILVFPFVLTPILTVVAVVAGELGGGLTVVTRSGGSANVDAYFVLSVAACALALLVLLGAERMYYRVEYVIAALGPSSARAVLGVHDALYSALPEDNAAVLQSTSRYAAGIRSRKRGLLNFPFWVIEYGLTLSYGLRPPFSSMSRAEQRWFLHEHLLRSPERRAGAFVPELADIAYQLTHAAATIVAFAHFSSVNQRHAIRYVPPGARDRLQRHEPERPAPFSAVPPLSVGPSPTLAPYNQVGAPLRDLTRVSEPEVPDEVDFLVVGSGAGGATVAYRLARAGAGEVLVVERGQRFSPLQDFSEDELEMLQKLYKEGGLQTSKRFDMTVLQGEAVGGTTIINNAVCFPLPASVRESWATSFGLTELMSELDAAYEQTRSELNIAPLPDTAVNQDVARCFSDAVQAYNRQYPAAQLELEPGNLRVNARQPVGCGLWNYGDRLGRKQSMLETYIPWAEGCGARVVSGLTAVRLLDESSAATRTIRRASSVLLRTAAGDFRRVRVRKAVIVAGGVIASSHFLMRSGIDGAVGRHVSCNFALPATLEFEQRLRAFDGTQITRAAVASDVRAVFETYFNPPAAFQVAAVPFQFAARAEIMSRYEHLVNFGALVGSEPNGAIDRKASLLHGKAFSWSLSKTDSENLAFALRTLAELGRLGGARRMVLPTQPGIYVDLERHDVNAFMAALKAYRPSARDVLLATAHPQGGNRMAGPEHEEDSQRVVDENFRVLGYENVYVADASLFPTSARVNPQWTILALATIAAGRILARHG